MRKHRSKQVTFSLRQPWARQTVALYLVNQPPIAHLDLAYVFWKHSTVWRDGLQVLSSLTESLFSAAFLAAVTLLSINAAKLGGGDQYAGIPSTISLLGRAAIAIPIGVLMDRGGRRPALLLGYLFGALGFAVSAVSVGWSSFFLLCLGAGLAGVANGASQQARYIASEVWPSDSRARIIGLIVFAGTIGAIFGPLLVAQTGALAEQLGAQRLCRPRSGRQPC